MEQIEAALDCGVSSVIADFQDLDRCGDAVRAAHAAQATILLATPRIHKPGETDVFELLAAHRPDGLLVRNLAGLGFCRRIGLAAVADFSLNAANELTVRWLHDQGARRVTAAYDLGRRQLLDLAAASRRSGSKWSCTATRPCSTPSTACSAGRSRKATTRPTAAAPAGGTRSGSATGWASSTRCCPTASAATRFSTPTPKASPTPCRACASGASRHFRVELPPDGARRTSAASWRHNYG